MLRSYLPRWLIALLSLLLMTAVSYLGAWLIASARFSLEWYWAALLAVAGVLFFAWIQLAIAQALFNEETLSVGVALLALFYLLAAAVAPSGGLLRLLASQPACHAELSGPLDREGCSFLCFDAVEVVEGTQVSFDVEEETYLLVPLRAPDAPPPYVLWVTQGTLEPQGRCVWRHFWSLPEGAARRSPLSVSNPITGDLVVDPAARLASYRWWFWFAIGVLSLLSLPILYWLISDSKPKIQAEKT
jgi:hypothetical protein